MAARPLDDHHVAVDHGAMVEKAPFEEVMDQIVFGQAFKIITPSVRMKRRRSSVWAGPPEVSLISLYAHRSTE
jgi:hypothetical protein